MIEVIFTLDYEIYGNGRGSLRELVYEPALRLEAIFEIHDVRFVSFVEAAELEVIEAVGADPAIDLVKRQLSDLYIKGHEIGLHVHPQWYNARYEKNEWLLDYNEYNLCTLPQERTSQLIKRSIQFLRRLLGVPDFVPTSFRAGNWLLQPTRVVANSLTEHGIKIDSSVYKGGLQGRYALDYRRSCKNGYYWPFSDDVNIPDSNGPLLEIPTYTKMVPIWEMFTSKRVGLQQKGATENQPHRRLSRLGDFLHLRHPMKLDFCRMTCGELTRMLSEEIRKDQKNPVLYRPIVAIGHTKDLFDYKTVEDFVSYMQNRGISISTLSDAYRKICSQTM